MLVPLQRQIRGHERAKRAKSMEEHVGEKCVASYNARYFAVVHRMDGRGVFDGIELALRFDRILDAIVFIHANSLDPGHSSLLLKPIIIRRIILNRQGAHAPGTLFALKRVTQPASWFAPA